MFIPAGAAKLAGAPDAVLVFDAVGLGDWFHYFTGGLEVAGALLLVTRPWRLGLVGLGAVMLGAATSHLGPVPGSPLVPAKLLALIAEGADGRAPHRGFEPPGRLGEPCSMSPQMVLNSDIPSRRQPVQSVRGL